MYVCSCFGITESQVKQHAADGACTPRQIASRCKAGTDCGGCVKRIQAILGRGTCPSRRLLEGRAQEPAEAAAGPGAPGTPAPDAPAQAPVVPLAPAEPLAPEPFTRVPFAA
ncbi:(2Fe-2S)-binding protein [Streptomyces fuscigenes]|uniref:(2Fe-2S)-binding protein n=1 Tax=Streptomyces fuscigenes TaxID=1528880 RepID=UPI001F46AABE|nr:(2Fe-2S)-binding protein [Streptomyces fuscigenes]MCF3964293.1 (2Fe-2S)-binding protein [Streptomyces fuscigenes]